MPPCQGMRMPWLPFRAENQAKRSVDQANSLFYIFRGGTGAALPAGWKLWSVLGCLKLRQAGEALA